MKKIRKSNLLTAILFIYTTIMYIYLFPRNHEISDTKKWVIVATSYAVLVILWFVLRRREKLREKREKDNYTRYDNKQ
ncbi:MAG: hypothetical protein IJA04_07550 [Bacteroidaceae bacterium]|nr:hypothetical protein [Bacteroidaceae bacterium]MBQ3623538.1 hypothetical protein [Bacteroidaceae bacterium]